MSAVYLAGRALASALGPDLGSALPALRRGEPVAGQLANGTGFSWPYYAMADAGGDWTTRTRRIVERVAADCGALGGARRGPLFLATSSLEMGAFEERGAFSGDMHSFAETVASWLDWRGPLFTVSTACTSGLNAVLSACTLLRHGAASDALVLGLELCNRVSVGGFGGLQLLSTTRARPLGADRDGLVLGEAVAALHLSTRPSRWRIAGGANVVDGSDPAGTVPEAVVAMCRQALAAAALAPADIGLIKLQAAGSPANDAAEVGALRQVFATLPPLVSLKAAIGHTLGAAGVAELALLTACIEGGTWPRLDYALDGSLGAALAERPAAARHVLAAILGFGGGHAAVVLEDGAA